MGWFVSSYNAAGVSQGKSGVLNAIVMSTGDRQKRERVLVWGDTEFCLEEFFWHRQIRYKASLKKGCGVICGNRVMGPHLVCGIQTKRSLAFVCHIDG